MHDKDIETRLYNAEMDVLSLRKRVNRIERNNQLLLDTVEQLTSILEGMNKKVAENSRFFDTGGKHNGN